MVRAINVHRSIISKIANVSMSHPIIAPKTLGYTVCSVRKVLLCVISIDYILNEGACLRPPKADDPNCNVVDMMSG
jgi:hypothetical protein